MVSQSSDENFDKIAVSLLSSFAFSYTYTAIEDFDIHISYLLS